MLETIVRIFVYASLLVALTSLTAQSHGDEPAPGQEHSVEAGHSSHGEAFNDGPRQAAYLMEGMGTIQFDVSTSHPLAKKFINQGVAQLHGFWYYEAERSFRQAAKLDPECAMSYWGMALANVNNRKRAEAFAAKAVEKKANATDREQMYIEAVRRRFQEKVDGKKLSKKEVAQNYTRDLEDLVLKYPDDNDARAWFALQLWENERNDLPLTSHAAIEAVLEDVFDKNPVHPAHHYRIHLWDKRKPAEALESAAQCGPSLPGIAHMWHMPGHIYSNLNRFRDAVWQQEASARVDHAQMIRDRLMPDQIHNFAHNNEWMIRNLQKIGRIDDAVRLATNMIQLPRHPKFNTLKSGSAKYGRERLLESLSMYRLWPELIAAADSRLIEPGDDDESQIELARHLGIAHAALDHRDASATILTDLQSRLAKMEAELKELSPPTAEPKVDRTAAKPDTGEPPRPATTPGAESTTTAAKTIDAAVAETPAASAIVAPAPACDAAPAVTKSEQPQAPSADDEYAPAAEDDQQENGEDEKKEGTEGDKKEGVGNSADEKKAEANRQRREREQAARKKELEARTGQLKSAIAAVEAMQLAAAGQWSQAAERFDAAGSWDKLLKVEWLAKTDKLDAALDLAQAQVKENVECVLPSAVETYVRWQSKGAKEAQISFDRLRELAVVSDLSTPVLNRLAPLAAELGYNASWAKPPRPSPDIGQRPPLDSLGPFRYSPYQGPAWQANSSTGDVILSSKFAGKPVIVIFYLGFGCLHCMEQLQEFSPEAQKFRDAGIELIAISTESPELLAKGKTAYTKPLDIPLVSDVELKAFKSFRCFDDFEEQPLHGTFLIDGDGRVLWQDISFDPFKDHSFLLREAQRLLALPS